MKPSSIAWRIEYRWNGSSSCRLRRFDVPNSSSVFALGVAVKAKNDMLVASLPRAAARTAAESARVIVSARPRASLVRRARLLRATRAEGLLQLLRGLARLRRVRLVDDHGVVAGRRQLVDLASSTNGNFWSVVMMMRACSAGERIGELRGVLVDLRRRRRGACSNW